MNLKLRATVVIAVLCISYFSSLTFSFQSWTKTSFPSHLHSKRFQTNAVEWEQFLVEFRGIQPAFRIDEFSDAFNYVMKQKTYEFSRHINLTFIDVITDEIYPEVPICASIRLPDEQFASLLAQRCGLVRSIVKVWGQDKDIEEVVRQTEANFNSLVVPFFNPNNTRTDNSWKVSFRRYGRSGRSGLDYDAKRVFLTKFSKVLKNLHGDVSLKNSSHELLYLEDWSTFRTWDNAIYVRQYTENITNSLIPNVSIGVASSLLESTDAEGGYIPLNCLLGRIVCEGTNVMALYDIKKRPYIGTTTMDAVCSHLAAVAAHVGSGDLILDPFCGTGSLLIACAALGAVVVGSDIDAASLGLDVTVETVSENGNDDTNVLPDSSNRNTVYSNTSDSSGEVIMVKTKLKSKRKSQEGSKNTRFKRHGVYNDSQEGKSTVDNFVFYGLRDRLKKLLALDATVWTRDDYEYDSDEIDTDAIILPIFNENVVNISDNKMINSDISEEFNDVQLPSLLDTNTVLQQTKTTTRITTTSSIRLFDAIVTDPPYSRREKVGGDMNGVIYSKNTFSDADLTSLKDTSSVTSPVMRLSDPGDNFKGVFGSSNEGNVNMGNPMAATITLLQVCSHHYY